jgi:hypothetical protein
MSIKWISFADEASNLSRAVVMVQHMHGTLMNLCHALSMSVFYYSLQLNVCDCSCLKYSLGAEGSRRREGGEELEPLLLFNPLWVYCISQLSCSFQAGVSGRPFAASISNKQYCRRKSFVHLPNFEARLKRRRSAPFLYILPFL